MRDKSKLFFETHSGNAKCLHSKLMIHDLFFFFSPILLHVSSALSALIELNSVDLSFRRGKYEIPSLGGN